MAQPESPSSNAAADEEEVLAKHRIEVKELRAQIQALKKSIPKGDKKRKKEVGAEIAQLEQDLEQRYQKELTDFRTQCALVQTESGEQNEATSNAVETSSALLEKVDIGGDEKRGSGKKSRAQKRKEKKAQLEKEKEHRIAEGEADSAINNPRLIEREKLTSMLLPLGLTIQDITPDGHCLYAAISDQLTVRQKLQTSVSELRSQCADYIHSNSSEFMPYLTDPDTGDQFTQEQFDHYCTEIADTAAWGGQLEIRALSHIYKLPIKVYQADTPVLCIGEEYSSQSPLHLSYHLHEYGLGEHYNSLVLTVQKK